jgi:DNA adenine methylase
MSTLNTPLRYPGGKQRLSPFIVEILQYNDIKDINYIEPYVGGVGVAINLLLNNKVKKIHLNDKSTPIYSFWKTVVENPEWLCKKILLSSLTIDEWKKQKKSSRTQKIIGLYHMIIMSIYIICITNGKILYTIYNIMLQKYIWGKNCLYSQIT